MPNSLQEKLTKADSFQVFKEEVEYLSPEEEEISSAAIAGLRRWQKNHEQ